jgi:hypothetical protein
LETTEVEEVPQPEFVPGSIHGKRFRSFWEEELGASNWVLDTLEWGYRLPFVSEPGTYEERNNATAREKPGEVRRIVAEMIALGVAKVVKHKPTCVSPLGLVERNGKFRLVWDASRYYLVRKLIKLELEQRIVFVSLQVRESLLERVEGDALRFRKGVGDHARERLAVSVRFEVCVL